MSLQAVKIKKRDDEPILAIVIPCYNEEAMLGQTAAKLKLVLRKMIKENEISQASFLYFVDDGSSDTTWSIIEQLGQTDRSIKALKLSRNVGHQNALLAGLLHVKDIVDCAISIDADLQQDEEAVPQFLAKYREGAEIVYGVRSDRRTDNFFKRVTALFFYRFMKLMGTGLIKNHADYRLLSKKALAALSMYGESNLFLRGIVTDLGFPSQVVNFEVRERMVGKSKYSMRRMLVFALDGITSFSVVPLRLIAFIGFLVVVFSIFMGFYILFEALILRKAVPGWASIVLPVYLIGGFQILCFGVIGEYVGKIYKEVKGRPRFIEEEEI